jgi:cytochrome c oxidase cbb3-type subunit III
MHQRRAFSLAAATIVAALLINAQTPRPPRPAGGIGRAGPAEGHGPIDPQAVDRGKKQFVASCGFCHGANATGGESGPDLIRSVLVAHDRSGDQIGPVILNGRPDKGMPKFSMAPAQVADIAAFLHVKAEEKSNRGAYQIQSVLTGNAKAGETYFASHCASCHSPSGDLAHVASRYDPVALQARFLYPRGRARRGQSSGPPTLPVKVTVTTPDGKTVSGTLDHIDDFNVSLRDSDGEFHSWLRDRTPGLKIEMQDPLAKHAELLDQYRDADMHNIVAYLETLK